MTEQEAQFSITGCLKEVRKEEYLTAIVLTILIPEYAGGSISGHRKEQHEITIFNPIIENQVSDYMPGDVVTFSGVVRVETHYNYVSQRDETNIRFTARTANLVERVPQEPESSLLQIADGLASRSDLQS